MRGGGDQTGAAVPFGGRAGWSAMDLLTLMLLYAASPAAAAATHHATHHHATNLHRDQHEARSITESEIVLPTPAPVPDSASASAGDRWQPYIVEASRRFDLPPDWIRSVMQAESSGRVSVNGRPITSPAGAMGLMQLMPETYARLREEHGLGPDPHNPRDNILAGAAYLRAMYDRFGWPGLFAAYNAGPARFEAHLRDDQPLPVETRRYLVTLGVDMEDAVAVALARAGAERAAIRRRAVRAKPPPPPARPVQLVRNDPHNNARGGVRAMDGP